MSKTFIKSSALFSLPSFSKGVARVIDLFGALDTYNYKDTEREADYQALKRDWSLIGIDIANAIKRYEEEKSTSTTPRITK